jgi:hypothetical protein
MEFCRIGPWPGIAASRPTDAGCRGLSRTHPTGQFDESFTYSRNLQIYNFYP